MRWLPGHRGFERNVEAEQLAKEGSRLLSQIQFEGSDIQQPKNLCRAGSKENINTDGDSFQVTHGKTFIQGLNSSLASLVRFNRANLRLATTWTHFRNHWAPIGFLQGNIGCSLCAQTPESAKHIILECEPLDIRRRKSFEGKQTDEEDACLGYKIFDLSKFTGVGRP